MVILQERTGIDFAVNPAVLVSATLETDINGDFIRLRYNDVNTIQDVDLIYESLQSFLSALKVTY